MRIIELAGYLFIFATHVRSNVIRRFTFDEDEDDNYRFEREDTEMFKGQGLWFYDDNENLVRATLNETNFSPFYFGFNDNLEESVLFKLYTREIEGKYQSLYVNDDLSFRQSKFDLKRPTRFITHGWMNSYKSAACTLIRDAYLTHGDYNVIVVDWSAITKKEYLYASKQVKKVGRFVSSMIDFLEKKGMDPSTTTLVGHSLGAHVMGLAGHFSNNTINYIIGLDPALPLFALAREGSRISTNDATYVEIIHTNAGVLGYKRDIGKSDFYPNGGAVQLGCLIDLGGACSHFRAFQFYAESILSKTGFYGKKCKNYASYKLGKCKGETALMGGPKDALNKPGKFFLQTRKTAPYAIGPENQAKFY